MKLILIMIFATASTGCMSARMVLDERWNPDQKPAYTDFFDHYLWGLSGTSKVNLQQVCMDQKPYAFERIQSGQDLFLSAITLGIYWPVTIKVWCGDDRHEK